MSCTGVNLKFPKAKQWWLFLNPFVPHVLNKLCLTKISILIEEGILKKKFSISVAPISVDEKSLS